MESPCTRVCQIDARSQLCIGCGRSLAEIAGWQGYSEAERRRVWERLRRKATEGEIRPPAT
ncbi:MAG: DUF1289 domain-containing protein [Planctomycetota bacterium]